MLFPVATEFDLQKHCLYNSSTFLGIQILVLSFLTFVHIYRHLSIALAWDTNKMCASYIYESDKPEQFQQKNEHAKVMKNYLLVLQFPENELISF